MDGQTILNHVIFQLTPTRTRYELFIVARGVTERITSGLLKPFLLHLQAAEEQLAKGGYSIKLEAPALNKAPWFTKGTVERFVRFVNSPEVIERGNTIDMELVQLEETIRMQTLTSARVEDSVLDASSSICLLGERSLSSSEKPRLPKKMRQDSVENDSGVGTNSKKQLLRALEARRLVLQKEQGMAFARAAAAGFELVPLLQLLMFAECFGAARLREACCNFVALCKKGQITGFCIGDLNLIDQDISWALSNSACVDILKSLEKGVPLKEKSDVKNTVYSKPVADPSVQNDHKLFDGSIGTENPSLKLHHEQQLPSSHDNLNPSGHFLDWSNSAALYQGWPVMYTDRNGPGATFNGYHYGYSPGSQQSFTTPSDVSPSGTSLYYYSAGVTNQQLLQANCQMASSQGKNAFPSLKKLQFGKKGKNKNRMDVKSDKSFTHGYEKDSSSDMTDSSLERSDSSKSASAAFQDDYASRVLVEDGLKVGLSTNAGSGKNFFKVPEVDLGFTSRTDSSGLSDRQTETKVPSYRGDDASLTLVQKSNASRLDGSFDLHEACETTLNVQKSFREVPDDNPLIFFEQCREDGLGSRSKKRLDFQEPESHRKQILGGKINSVDDSFFVCSPAIGRELTIKPAIESELQGNQIYDMMSKQALRVNSVISTRHEPDDLLMLPRQRNHDSSRNSRDVLNIDAELRGSAKRASLLKPQKTLMGSEPSQERVKNFLNQYNEKREAKLRGNASSSKSAEREGKLKATKEDLNKRKSDLVKATRPERAKLQTEAQLRADKLRIYKADLLRSRKEKEEEERRRLEELRAQRQLRIAARSNLGGRSNASSSNPRGQKSLQASASRPSPATSRLSALHKSRPSLRDTSSMQIARNVRELALLSSPKGAVRQQPRSSSPPVLRQTGKASIGSQSSMKAETLKNPQRTTSPPIKTSRVPSAVFNKNLQMGRPTLMGKQEISTIVSKKQGFLPGSHSGLPLDRSQKRLPSKGMVNSVDETKQGGRTFLKKGSGTGASSRSVQRMKPSSPHSASTMDKRPLLMSGTQASRLDLKQRNKAKISGTESRVTTPGPMILKSKSSMSTPSAVNGGSTRVSSRSKLGVDSTIREAGQEKVHLEKPSVPKNRGTGGRAMQSSWPRECSAPEKDQRNPQRATLKGSPGDFALSRLTLSDTSCTVNRDPSIHLSEVQGIHLTSTVSGGNFSKSQSIIVVDSPQTLCNQQSNGLKKLPSLEHMSMPIIGSTMSEEDEVEDKVHEGKRLSDKAPSNQLKEQPVSDILWSGFKRPSQPSNTAVHSRENHSHHSKGSSAKALMPFSFLGTLRNKAAEVK